MQIDRERSVSLVRRFMTLSMMLAFGILSACGQSEDSSSTESSAADRTLTVYKTKSCSCCSEWVDHIQQGGLSAIVVNQDSVAHIKDFYQLPANARSCHTAVSSEGFVFEGHVPAKFIKQFLSNPPAGSVGLIVPAMPLGSPGMEYQDKFNPYQILSMNQKGVLEPYASIDSYAQQFD